MRTHTRPYDDRHDFEKLWRFLEQDYARRQDRFVWLTGRLGDWRYGLWTDRKSMPSFFREYCQLWLDSFDRLLGLVLSEDGGDVFTLFTLCSHHYLYRDILDWTLAHWGPRYPALKTEVHERQPDAIAVLESRGFCRSGVVATTRSYDVAVKAQEPVRLPPGFRIEDMAHNGDFTAKALLNVNGFEGRDEVSEAALMRFAYSRENPIYDPTLDFSVVTADGLHVASCVGFADPAAGMAEIEKICTHPAYRRQGLAEAAVRACFHRLHQRGLTRAYITGYSTEANGLYEKLGPCAHKRWFQYVCSSQRSAVSGQ